MLSCSQYNLIRMPRCGTTNATRTLTWTAKVGLTHDGWWGLPDGARERQCYAFVREPFSWYLSLYAVLMGEESPLWRNHLGLYRRLDWTATVEIMTGTERAGNGQPISHSTMSTRNPSLEMNEAGIGLWAWWFLHCCAEEQYVYSAEQPLAPVRLLWLHEGRKDDLHGLAYIAGEPIRSTATGVNARIHKTVSEAFTPELREMVELRDGIVYRRAIALHNGLGDNAEYRRH